MPDARELEDQIVASLRRIIRAIDLQSRRLLDRYKLTGPQLATLREVERLGQPSTSALARAVHLSQPTVSGILDRLERSGLIVRARSTGDRRNVVISITDEGRRMLSEAPSLLQDRFRTELGQLEGWERYWLLSALERIASMMDAGQIEARLAPEAGSVTGSLGEEHGVPAGDEPADEAL